jgi:glyoxylase-like metal-dependent hydrolase (beta-lactamase superfamily II)/rhodanese-related sulfurtransferase
MYFKQMMQECGCSAYLVASRQTHEAMVVDPPWDLAELRWLLDHRAFTVRYVVDTHLHADHVSGARALAAETGADLCMHRSAEVAFPFRGLDDGEELPLGQLVVRVLHTPGHRPEAISLLVINPPRGPEPSMLLSGDTLLVGDVGRPDFGGAEGAAQLYDSLHRLLLLEDYVEVFPGHFEGPCGRGMCGRPSTTIGFERRFNPVLRLPDRAAFVAAIGGSPPAHPLNMDAILATNQGLADMPWAQPVEEGEVAPLAPAEARSLVERGAVWLLDVREPDEFARAHIPDAHSIPQGQLASRLAEVPRDRPLLVTCQVGGRSLAAARFLKSVGYPDVRNLAGGTAAWQEAGLPIAGDATAGDSEHNDYQLSAPIGTDN